MEDKRFELTIESLAWEGWGVGRWAGKAIFVPFTAPGDVIGCAVTQDRGRFAFGTLLDLVRPSDERVSAPCPVFGRCGGCQWQHVRYGAQLWAKRGILADALARIGRLIDPNVPAAIGSEPPYGWRTTVDLAYEVGQGGARVGFYARHGSEIVAIDRCPIAGEAINARLGRLSEALGVLGPGARGEIRLLAGGDDRVSAHLLPGQGVTGAAAGRLQSLAGLAGLTVQTAGPVKTYGDPIVWYPGWDGKAEAALSCRPSDFVQANPAVNRRLIERLMLFPFSGKRVLELYSGIGNLTVPLARAGAAVTSVEGDPASVEDARATVEELGIAGVELLTGDVKAVLSRPAIRSAGYDVAVLDPPRTGARSALEAIAGLRPHDIFYVSCWPPTLARDLAVLAKDGWRLRSAEPLDMFPQTFHVEALCHLERA